MVLLETPKFEVSDESCGKPVGTYDTPHSAAWPGGDMLAWDESTALPVQRLSSGYISCEEEAELCFQPSGLLWRFPALALRRSQCPRELVNPKSTPDYAFMCCPYSAITSFDIHLERTWAARFNIPLLRLVVEQKVFPTVLDGRQQESSARLKRPARLVVAWIRLADAALLEEYLTALQQQEMETGFVITMVLPSWVLLMHNLLPPFVYSPRTRILIEQLIVLWMMLSGFWALWQLYQHVDMFAAAMRPLVRVLVKHFGQLMKASGTPRCSLSPYLFARHSALFICPPLAMDRIGRMDGYVNERVAAILLGRRQLFLTRGSPASPAPQYGTYVRTQWHTRTGPQGVLLPGQSLGLSLLPSCVILLARKTAWRQWCYTLAPASGGPHLWCHNLATTSVLSYAPAPMVSCQRCNDLAKPSTLSRHALAPMVPCPRTGRGSTISWPLCCLVRVVASGA